MGSTVRRSSLVVLALALALAVIGAAPAATTGAGSVQTTLRLATLAADGLPGVGDVDAVLGELAVGATTIDAASALILLEGLRTGDQSQVGWSASSADGRSSGSVERSLDVAGVLEGGVSLVDYVVDAGDGTATADLGTLAGDLAAGPVGLSVSVGDNGVGALVTTTSAEGVSEVTLEGLDLDLADLLPLDILSQLPLGLALDLVDTLQLELDSQLSGQVEEVRELIDDLGRIVQLATERDGVRAELRALLADDPGVIAAEQLVADAEDAVADAEAVLAAAQEDVASAERAVEDATAQLQSAEADLAEVDAAVAELSAELSAIDAELTRLRSDLSLASSLTTETDLTTLIDGLTYLEDRYGTQAGCTSLDSLDLLTVSVSTLRSIASCYETYLSGQVAQKEDERDAVQAELDAAERQQAEAQAAVDGAELVLAAAEDDLVDARVVAAAAQDTLDQARAGLIDAYDTLDAALAAAADSDEARALLELLEDLKRQIIDLLDLLETTINALPDLDALLGSLRDALADAPLLDVGQVTLTVDVRADASAGRAVVSCVTDRASVLGVAVDGTGCDALFAGLDVIDEVLANALAVLQVAQLPTVDVGGLSISTSASDAPDADGVTRAAASVTGLQVSVPSVEIGAVVDELVGELLGLVDEVATLAEQLGVHGLSVQATDGRVSSFSAHTLGDQLAALEGTLNGLPTGDALAGLSTTGLDVVLGGLDTEAVFQAAGAVPGDGDGTDPGADPGAPGGPGGGDGGDAPAPAPGSGPGDPSAQPPTLPVTGGGGAALALASMAAAVALRRLTT